MTNQQMAWEAFLQKVDELLGQPGETYESIANRIGVGRSAVFDWRNKGKGGKRVPFETMCRYLRGVGLDPEDFFTVKEIEESDFAYVPKANTQLGAGSSLVVQDGHGKDHAFRREFIRSLGHVDTKHLVLFDVIGDSMEPLILEGDTVLVERFSEPKPRNGEVWAVWVGDEVLIKRVQAKPGGWLFTSDNPRYTPIETSGEEENFGLIGRVRWLGRVF